MKKIYFHIGLGKTGTSYLQSAFAINSDLYKNHGLKYPDLQNNFDVARKGLTTSGNAIKLAASSQIMSLRHIEPLTIERLLEDLDQNYNYLLSSEWLSGCPIEFFKKIEECLNGKFLCEAIIFIRNPAEHIRSNYLQGVKIGKYKNSIDIELPIILENMRSLYQLIIDFPFPIKLLNYDIHKDNLLRTVDNLIFGKHISETPKKFIVNPSPTNHQTKILLLSNLLGISNFGASMQYIESAIYNSNNNQKPFLINKAVYLTIFESLSKEILEINKLLPINERLIYTCENLSKENDDPLLYEEDIDFLKKLLDTKPFFSKEDLSFIKKSAELDISSKQLPHDFDVLGYLVLNPDIVHARANPIQHYIHFGINEGRKYLIK